MGLFASLRPAGVWWWAAAVVIAAGPFAFAGSADDGFLCEGVAATIIGSPEADVLIGTEGPDVIVALGGDDEIRGNGGADLICAGPGDDIVFGGKGPDVIRGSDGNDRIRGNGGHDTIIAGEGRDKVGGGRGDDEIDGGPGNDVLVGDGGDDHLIGEGGNDQLRGGRGNDEIEGGWGYNRMYGEDGNDRIVGGGRGESIDGGEGNDRIFGNGGSDWVLGGPGHDLINGGDSSPAARVCDPAGSGTCRNDAVDVLDGGDGEDRILGTGGDDLIYGRSGFDTLEGGGGDDEFFGGAQSDYLDGGSGNDEGTAGSGVDVCNGIETLNDECDAPDVPGSVAAWRGSDDAQFLSVRLLNVVLLQSACGDDARHLAQLERVASLAPADVRPELRSAAAHLRRSAQACNVDDAVWAAALEAAIDRFDLIAPSSPAADPSDPLLHATVAANASVEAVTDWLNGNPDGVKASSLWVVSQHMGKHYDLIDAAEAGGFDIAMVGSSLVVNGLDPERFTDQDGRQAFNAGIFGMGPEAIELWLPTVVRLAQPDLVMYGVLPRDIREKRNLPDTCLADVSNWATAGEMQASVFAPVEALDGVWWETLLFGDPMAAEPPALYRDDFTDRGGLRDAYQASPAEIQASTSRGAWEGPFPECEARNGVLASNVAAITATGADAVVVFMPMSTVREGMYEGGRAEVAEILARMEAAALGAGATAVIDLSGSVPDGEFRDLSHVNRIGARRFTDALVAALAGLGL